MDTLEIINSFLDQFGYYNDVKMPDLSMYQGIKKVVICGMGGSAFPADMVSDHIIESYKRDIVFVNRNYNLPYWVDEETLVIASSFSGSTEETLSCMNEAIEKKIPVLGLSMGGEVSRICSEKNLPYVSLPKVIMPRFGAGFLMASILRILVELKLIPNQKEEMDNVKILLDHLKINIQKTAEGLSKSIKNRLVIIYTDSIDNSAGNAAKICINETAKVMGYHNIFSESNHNELAALTESPYPMALILLTYPNINPRINLRFDLLNELLTERDVVYKKVNSNFEKILYRDIYFTLFFTYLGYYLALESDHDPVGTPTQDQIKVLLKKNR